MTSSASGHRIDQSDGQPASQPAYLDRSGRNESLTPPAAAFPMAEPYGSLTGCRASATDKRPLSTSDAKRFQPTHTRGFPCWSAACPFFRALSSERRRKNHRDTSTNKHKRSRTYTKTGPAEWTGKNSQQPGPVVAGRRGSDGDELFQF
ncbi:oxidoreductase [Anopheles sinensis]|uniref:Oxidoreductase n=1 Tax=Anopheles sinensis TaxID=74873 RepID=A0A084VEM1_ANOSI|nr:oxidoreductase [Anopheles sinensis]